MKIALLVLLALFNTTFPQKNNFVYTEGKEIMTPEGKPLLLKGINLGNWLVPEGYMFHFKEANSPRLINEVLCELIGPDKAKDFWTEYRNNYITQEDIKFIKKIGLNSVRIPFNYRLFVLNDDPGKLEGPGYSMLDNVINWCKTEGVYIILDMHCAPGGQTGDNIDDSYGYPYLFENDVSQNLTVAIWHKITERYKDEQIIIGYDLLNEPIATYFDSTKFNPLLEPLYKLIVKSIREADKNHIIFLGGAQWDSNFSMFGKPFDKNLVYTFHRYWSDTTQSVVQEFVDFRDKFNVPMWLGESGENTDEWISSFRTLLERNNFGWCFWPYKKLDSNRGIVSIPMTKEWDTIIQFANNDRSTFEKIRKSRPSKEIVKKALEEYLKNSLFKNCIINKGYIEALGMNSRR